MGKKEIFNEKFNITFMFTTTIVIKCYIYSYKCVSPAITKTLYGGTVNCSYVK